MTDRLSKDKQRMSFALDKEAREQLERLAQSKGMTLSELVREALAEKVEKSKKTQGGKK